MSELIGKLHELQALPKELHWFCEAWTEADGALSDTPVIKSEVTIHQDVHLRREQATECLTFYSYDDARVFQDQLAEAIDLQLGRCDVCIEEYYKAKQRYVEKLRHEYEEDAILIVEKAFNDRDIERINRGLDNAALVLRNLEPLRRHKKELELSSQLAVFEALCNDAFVKDEISLDQHFQEPFTLVQTNKKLNVARYLPAATAFLFDTCEERCSWAVHTWTRYRECPTTEAFDFGIRDPLSRILQTFSVSVPDGDTLQRIWYGIGLIIDNLDNDIVTHSLRALDIDVFKTALDHLKYDAAGFRYVVETIQKFLELAPKDFWDAMGAISPTTFVEQIFNNARYESIMRAAHPSDAAEASALKDMLSWIKPMMASLETAHQANVCKTISYQLMDRFQADHLPEVSRSECYRTGLATLTWTLGNCNKEGATLTSTGRIVANKTLSVVNEHIAKIIKIPSLPDTDALQMSCAELGLRTIKIALALECKAARTEQDLIRQARDEGNLSHGLSNHASALWDAVVDTMDYGNVELARTVLVGINDLTGLEKFKVAPQDVHTKEKSSYNIKLGRLVHLVGQIMERIADFSPRDLDLLYRSPESATALIATLYAADANLFEAGVNLIKVVSSELARKEAIGHIIRVFFDTSLNAFSWALKRITRTKSYAPCSRMLKTSTDILDVLCDSQDGLLRVSGQKSVAELKAIEHLWQYQWEALKMIYEATEEWGKNKSDDPFVLKEFCRDTMQFSEKLFDQYIVFATAIESGSSLREEGAGTTTKENLSIAKLLLQHSAKTMLAMSKWLRLRDLFLVDIAVNLTKKVLNRLTESNMSVDSDVCSFLEQVIRGGPQAKTHLSPNEKAELARALGSNIGRVINSQVVEVDSEAASDRSRTSSAAPKVRKKHGDRPLNLEDWRDKADKSKSTKSAKEMVEISDDEFDTDSIGDQEILSVSRSVDLMKRMKEQRDSLPSSNRALPFQSNKASELVRSLHGASKTARSVQSGVDQASFREKREKEREAKKKRDLENIAMVKRRAGIAGVPLGAGSGLDGIGIKGKDHAPKGPSMMVSSGSESESDDDLDVALFGDTSKDKKVSESVKNYQAQRSVQMPKGPIKKTRQIRSAKDMRARLAPDLTSLHKTILAWDYFHDGDFPPGSQREDYSLVTNTFRTPLDYERTFEPLLILEAWQGLLKSREEGTFKPFEMKIANRMNVDAFLEISTTMPMTEAKELALGEADIILMSKGQNPTADKSQAHCFSRIWKLNRKKGTMEITLRANVGNDLVAAMVPNGSIYCTKIVSITPLEREYGALLGLKYFDLCDEITRAQPSPLLEYREKQLTPLIDNYKINVAQARAVRSAIDNDAFTLIQGPPGSGKTKTIVAIVGALLTSSFVDVGLSIARPQGYEGQMKAASKKLLICAPSNAAVDELVMRLKDGIKTTRGTGHKPAVVRLGRSDAINANVLDVTLEELVNAKLNIVNKSKTGAVDDIGKLMQAHKSTCENFNAMRGTIDALKATGKQPSPLQNQDLEILKRKKQQLSNQIDQARDSGNTAARDAEISRRLVQQEILDGAHVICATLSGSGHEMFQGLNIEFETVVIDEAAQSIELSALIPLKYGCSKCILVGDPKQLPPTVLSREAARFQYEQSLFVRMQLNHPRDVHLLDTQYRMHPEISAFPSSSFYDGRLLDGPNMAKLRRKPWHQSDLLGPYRFFDVQGSHQSAPRGHSLVNPAEIEVALKLYHRLISDCKGYDFDGKIGIITPYKSQLRELRARFARVYGEAVLTRIEFNTTDAFQGRECEVILFSCVRASMAKGIGFLSDIRRMNVGITRAKSSLWVLGNSQSLMQGEYWGRLIEDAKRRARYTTGDLITLLAKPLLDIDIEMPDAPSGLKTKDEVKSAKTETRPASYQPSGGTNGLNSRDVCAICGSFAHRTNVCDNEEAVEASQGRCHRCRGLGHRKSNCTEERCLLCGAIGHTKTTCTSTSVLTSKDRMLVGRQEIAHKIAREREPEQLRKKHLGDHDPKIPHVKETKRPPSMEEEKKRKRDPASPVLSAPRGPKMPHTSPASMASFEHNRSAQQPPYHSKESLQKNGHFSSPSMTNPIQKRVEDPRQQSTSSKHHDTNSHIRPSPPATVPPSQKVMRPPKKKKPVDPFIRPKHR